MDSYREAALLRGGGRRSRRVPALTGSALGPNQRRENQGASLWSPGQVIQAFDPEEMPSGEGSREDTVKSQEGKKGGRGCEKKKPGCGREDEKGSGGR